MAFGKGLILASPSSFPRSADRRTVENLHSPSLGLCSCTASACLLRVGISAVPGIQRGFREHRLKADALALTLGDVALLRKLPVDQIRQGPLQELFIVILLLLRFKAGPGHFCQALHVAMQCGRSLDLDWTRPLPGRL